MIRIALLFLVLFGCWYVFSGYDTPFFLIAGMVSSLLAILISFFLHGKEKDSFSPYISIGGAFYAFWLIKQMLESAIDVSKYIWQIEPRISPTLAWIPCSQPDDVGKAIYGSSITLTPGTVCIDIENNNMLVHALIQKNIHSLMEQEMDRRITALGQKI